MDIDDPNLPAEERARLLDEIDAAHLAEAGNATLARLADIEQMIAATRKALAARTYDQALLAGQRLLDLARQNQITCDGMARVDLQAKARKL